MIKIHPSDRIKVYDAARILRTSVNGVFHLKRVEKLKKQIHSGIHTIFSRAEVVALSRKKWRLE